MTDQHFSMPAQTCDALDDNVEPDGARLADRGRAAEWSSDRALDPGDSHDKGERSLCVGEAA